MLIPISERSRDRLLGLRLSFSLIFPYFLNCILRKHMLFFFFSSGTSPFSEQKTAFEKPTTEAQRLSLL